MECIYTFKQKTIRLERQNDKINIFFFGDVHRDTQSCDVDRWKQFLKEAKETPNAYYFYMGDGNDFASTKEKKIIENSALHDTTRAKLDMVAEQDIRAFCAEISFMKGKLLGCIEGNHSWIFMNGKRSDESIAERMDSEYLGWLSAFVLNIEFNSTKSISLHLVLCHGRAGGKRAGNSINQVEDLRNQIFPAHDIYCVSDDTEILTVDGWENYKNIKLGQSIYSFNPDKKEIQKDVVKDIIKYGYDGKMINIKNSNTDQLVIPEHRIYYKYKNNGYLVKKASEIKDYSAQILLPLAGINNENVDIYSDDFCSLVGWIISEGHFKGKINDLGNGILIYQKRKEKVDIIRNLLISLKYHFSEKVNTEGVTVFYIKTKSALEIRKYIDNKKTIPAWIYKLNNKQFDLFFESFVLGDGSKISKSCGTIYSSEKGLMDDFQAVLCLHGYRTILKYRKRGFKDGGWVIIYCKKDTTELSPKKRFKEVDYSGNVWCVSTNNKTFIARRNGKVFITGNCMAHDHNRGAWPISSLIPSKAVDWSIKQKRQWLCRSGSFKKGYHPGLAGYEVGRLLRPSDLGALQLQVGLYRVQRAGSDITYPDIKAII